MHRKLSAAVNEKDVENVYRAELVKLYPKGTITSPYGVDGLLEAGPVRVLCEFKYSLVLTNKTTQANILTQTVYYLKKMSLSGDTLPSVVFVGDQNEWFVVPTAQLTKYLDKSYDWTIAPSQAHKANLDLVQALKDDTEINPVVYNITDSKFSPKQFVEQINAVTADPNHKTAITIENIEAVHMYFHENVLPKNSGISSKEEVNMFAQLVVNQQENYLHPMKRNILVTRNFGEVKLVSTHAFEQFGRQYDLVACANGKAKDEFIALVDRLVEDKERRMRGEFFTPTAFVNLSHDYITKALGPNWKDEYVVWDCAWGTGNLTRDYQFKELYCSTLEESDLHTAAQAGNNPQATKFKFDFLNGDMNNLPEGLKKALNDKSKKILFFINPPYGTAGVQGEESKKGIAQTKTGERMKLLGWGSPAQQLYAQFLFRIWELNQNANVTIAAFAKALYKTGGSYEEFRQKFYQRFKYDSGFIFQASEFAGVSAAWAIDFSIWKGAKSKNLLNQNSPVETRSTLVSDIVVPNKSKATLEVIGVKSQYSLDNIQPASEWVREPVKGLKTVDAPQISSAMKVKQEGRGRLVHGALGYMHNDSNSVEKNAQLVGLYASCFSNANGLSVLPSNFSRAVCLFAARKSIKGNWLNDKDEYLAPDETHPAYQQFKTDALVYSLFNNSSQQSSLREITYKGNKHNIKNEWFWLKPYNIQKWATEASYDALYRDAKNYGGPRHVNEVLSTVELDATGKETFPNYEGLSPEARDVLDKATALLEKSMKARKLMSEDHPEYHLDSWDAGYAQLKLVWEEYHKEEFKALRKAYKALEDRLIPIVYDVGFLRR
jgi:hypothetical protein